MPEPIIEIGRIGDKSNARRRPASTRRVLNNNCNNTKPTMKNSKKKIVNAGIPLSNYTTFSENSSVFPCSYIYSSDSDSDLDSDEEMEISDPDVIEPVSASLHGNG